MANAQKQRPLRDVYIVSIPRTSCDRFGNPLSREQVRRMIRDYLRDGDELGFDGFLGVKVWAETRRQTETMAAVYGIRPRTLSIDNPPAVRGQTKRGGKC